jgi:hypothetical protein
VTDALNLPVNARQCIMRLSKIGFASAVAAAELPIAVKYVARAL